ncbi:MAG TPA: hypothetical protein VG167_18920 [Verrucomicrobiae bacterium]|nr:hypothetical protein [Verrucomicrobiae bacterium]
MMKTFKSLLVAGALCAAAFSSHAQFFGGTYGSQTLSAVPSILTLSIATNVNTMIGPIGNGHSIFFQMSAAGSNSTTAALTAVFYKSPDGVNIDTTAAATLPLTLAGTATVIGSTNLDIGACGYIQLGYITNAAGVGVTNLTFRYALKPGY